MFEIFIRVYSSSTLTNNTGQMPNMTLFQVTAKQDKYLHYGQLLFVLCGPSSEILQETEPTFCEWVGSIERLKIWCLFLYQCFILANHAITLSMYFSTAIELRSQPTDFIIHIPNTSVICFFHYALTISNTADLRTVHCVLSSVFV